MLNWLEFLCWLAPCAVQSTLLPVLWVALGGLSTRPPCPLGPNCVWPMGGMGGDHKLRREGDGYLFSLFLPRKCLCSSTQDTQEHSSFHDPVLQFLFQLQSSLILVTSPSLCTFWSGASDGLSSQLQVLRSLIFSCWCPLMLLTS